MSQKTYCVTSDSEVYILWRKDENGISCCNIPKDHEYLDKNVKCLENRGYVLDEEWGKLKQAVYDNSIKSLKLEMTDKEIISMLLNRSIEINGKINNAILDILRLGSHTERGKQIIPDLIESIEYTLEEIDRIIKRN